MVRSMVNIVRMCALSGGLCGSLSAMAGHAESSVMNGADTKLFGVTITSEYTLDKDSRITGIQLVLPVSAIDKALGQPMSGLKIDLPVVLKEDSLIQHITIDWNPEGHDPAHVYDRPHFDFHFYFIGKDEVHAIDCSDRTPIPASLVPDDYVLPPLDAPTACVPAMGIHAVPLKDVSPGFTFTETPIYGYYQGRFIFFEPMITRDHLLSRQPVVQTIQYPEAFLVNVKNHFIPKTFRLSFDSRSQTYLITLGN
ncbi:MAG TPA: hypothetical protein VE954_20070 [Oligoflexus sp.]|uniref:hypothetical protein n=1 Tax=Oligoflexus sp. TaxID=1971216 RepID=UPI002D4BE431|nr:hypothetical protein [Oligoflexus sp.]HYX35399.1 hypothetical protein [Oligoflexus sp.]